MKLSVLFLVCLVSALNAGDSPGNTPVNIVLISLNALRADHLKAYGYSVENAPNISKLAGKGVLFEQNAAQSSWTLPSLVSLFTGKYPGGHGVLTRNDKLAASENTLALTLKKAGYTTAAFTGGLDMSGSYGLNRGFDVYFDSTGASPMGSFKEIMPRAIGWLAINKVRPFFMFLDSYDIHPPFDKTVPGSPAPAYDGVLKGRTLDYQLLRDCKDREIILDGKKIKLSNSDMAYIKGRYDAGVFYADSFLGLFFSKLAELGLESKTVIVVTSEHGEELGDRGGFDRFGKGNLYDEVIKTPLIITAPFLPVTVRRISSQTQNIDIMPTILALAGIAVPDKMQGRSLTQLMYGKPQSERPAFSEAAENKYALRTPEWKLISDGNKYELYNLKDDVSELHNVAAEKPDMVYKLAQKMMAWRSETEKRSAPDKNKVPITTEMKEKLKAAGYWR